VNTTRSKTLQELENCDWGEPSFDSSLVSTVHRLRRTPIEEFTIEDLRVAIGQDVGLPHLIPLAIERLEENPLAQGDHYPGDLLKSVLVVDELFWRTHAALRAAVEIILLRAEHFLQQSTEDDHKMLKESLNEAAEWFRSSVGIDP